VLACVGPFGDGVAQITGDGLHFVVERSARQLKERRSQ
jgi:hypothetical protein